MLNRLSGTQIGLALSVLFLAGIWGLDLTSPASQNGLAYSEDRETISEISASDQQGQKSQAGNNASEFKITDALLVLFNGLLALFTYRLWQSTQATVEKMGETAELAKRQFALEGRQADLAEKQHALARLQHIAANKPLLRVRGINLGAARPDVDFFVEGDKIVGSLVVANSGATDAIIISSGYRFFWTQEGLPMRPPLDEVDVTPLLLTDDPIVGFGSRGVQIESKGPLSVRGDMIRNDFTDGWILYIMGFVHYADVNQAERFMGFCRRYLPADRDNCGPDGMFVTVSNSDYEYSD